MEYKIEEFEGGFINDISSDYGDSDINALTYKIIGSAMEVYNKFGKGFSEKVYQDCLCIEFDERKMFYEREKKFDVIYKGIIPIFTPSVKSAKSASNSEQRHV